MLVTPSGVLLEDPYSGPQGPEVNLTVLGFRVEGVHNGEQGGLNGDRPGAGASTWGGWVKHARFQPGTGAAHLAWMSGSPGVLGWV